jgi:hypothetical protein
VSETQDEARAMLIDLYRLVEALDRRKPQLERIAEPAIARDAADLRDKALALIQHLEHTTIRH